jgi:integrase/recombinase XerC
VSKRSPKTSLNRMTKRQPPIPLPPDIEAFLHFKRAERKSGRTLDEYVSLLRRLLKHRYDLKTSNLNGVEGAELLIGFVESMATKSGNPIGSETARKYYSMLGTYTSWLTASDRLYADPAAKLPRISRKKGRPRPMPELNFRRLIEAAPTSSDRLALLLMGRCGLRRAELRGVRLRDFDLSGPIATVSIVGKGNKKADQPLLEVVRLQAEAVLMERPNLAEYVQYPVRVSNLPGQVGRQYHFPLKEMSENAQDNWWAATLLAADVPPIWGMHSLRHLAGTHFYEATKDAVQTQHFMRHSKMETTFESYVAGTDEARRNALLAASAAHVGFSAGGQS